MSTTFFNNLALVHNLSLTGQKSVYFPHKQKQSTEAMPLDKRPSGTQPPLYVPPNCPHAGLPDNSCAPSPSLQKKEVDRPYSGTLPKPQPATHHPRPPKPCHSGTKRPRNTALVKEAPFTSSPRVSPLPPPCKPGGPRKRFLWMACAGAARGRHAVFGWRAGRDSGAGCPIRPSGFWGARGPVAYRPPARGPGMTWAGHYWNER